MSDDLTALILDDDPDSVALTAYAVRRAVPQARVRSRATPDVIPGYDLYVLDNDFRGTHRAGTLAARIRAREPRAIIVAFSAYLDADCLKSLINAGCDRAFEKGSRDELLQLTRFVAGRVNEPSNAPATGRPTLASTVRSIRGLLRDWNLRLAFGQTMWPDDGGHAAFGTTRDSRSV